MSLNKRIRKKPVGKMSNQKEYPKLTMDQAIDLVIAGKSAEGLRKRTLRDYRRDWRYFVAWLHKNYEIESVDELSPQVFRYYINYLKYDAPKYDGHKYIQSEQGIGLSDTTINIRLRVYRAMFNYLEREDLIEVNPMSGVRLLKQDIDLTNCFTDEEVKEVLKQPNQRDYVGFRDYVAMILLLDSGIRANELLSLRAGDVDFQTRFITLNGDKNKNRKPRIVPISAHTVKLLLQLINENKKHFSTDRIFLSSYGEPLGQNHFNKRLKYYAEKAGIKDKKVTAHVYRHTWAKNMTLNGCDSFALQKMGGWSDIRTMRRYVQMDTEDLRKSHDTFSPVMKMVNKRK
ncbi:MULTISPECIES: tyrosine-type recombinase/integrase [Bacillus amyloliquefaciens group]|uniref:tyrosine-type recombinase/integrase n=1 Tax=Bacillus amyloliquefaciens group TaxID=1938374 RepID=UPI000B51B8C8|nr:MULTISPECIES: tyrosine-type recombinase/integrase [Bacillus amyloliquefaciens group]ASF29969.1 integrase [Bacillus amyloliquefaciens]MDQ8092549.1 tyrosine-type recombinase/integrase [Bacillus amyloliquefaciens]